MPFKVKKAKGVWEVETLAQVFYWDFREIFKNTFLKEHLRTTVLCF